MEDATHNNIQIRWTSCSVIWDGKGCMYSILSWALPNARTRIHPKIETANQTLALTHTIQTRTRTHPPDAPMTI